MRTTGAWICAHAGAILFVFALLIGFYQMLHPDFGFGRGYEMATIARNLAAEGTFSNPFPPDITGPTAVNPPLYPAALALLIKIFGFSPLFVLAACFGNILVNAMIAALLPRLSTVFYGDVSAGAYAGVFWLSSMRLLPQWDVSYTVLGLLLFSLITAYTIERRDRRWLWPAAAGAVAGLLFLMNPAAVFVCFPWLAFLLWRRRIPFQHGGRYTSMFLLAMAVCIVPWVVRNYRIWHTPVLRTNFGMTIYSSNNSCAESSLFRNTLNGCYQSTHPVTSAREIKLLKELGEVQYDRLRTADTINWIRSHPDRFRQLTLDRVIEFWFPDALGETRYGFWLGTILSVPGILLMAKRREPVTLFVLLVWLVFPIMYYIVVTSYRYRYPILWTSQLAAGYCIVALLRCLDRQRSRMLPS